MAEQLDYWREQLAAPTCWNCRLTRHDRRCGIIRATAGVLPSAGLSEELKRVSQEAGATLFMTLLVGFQVLLSRYSGQADIVVGTPVANRTLAETEGLIGLFINTLALRTRVSGELTWAEMLNRVREASLGAYEHQELPFEKLVEELQPERELNRHPLFQVMLVLQNAPREALEQGLSLRMLRAETNRTKFDLTVTAGRGAERLAGSNRL